MSSEGLPSASQLVRDFGAPAKRSLGQNFIVDPSILDRLVDAAGVEPGDDVLEIGPGPGTLTRTLLERGCRVLAVELDRRAVDHLAHRLNHPHLRVLEGDALALDLAGALSGPTTAVANLPYNIATEIFFRIEILEEIQRMVLMFQREVALRFCAAPGGGDYGPLAIVGRIRWEPTVAARLPPGAFLPRPKVHSAAIRFARRSTPLVPPEVEPTFRRLVRAAFQKRRKTVKNALAGHATVSALEDAGIDPALRPERIPIERFIALALLRATESG